MPEEEQIRVAEIMRDSANKEHAAGLRRVARSGEEGDEA